MEKDLKKYFDVGTKILEIMLDYHLTYYEMVVVLKYTDMMLTLFESNVLKELKKDIPEEM